VHELLKANPRKDIQNSYGHTAASYAATNKFKAIADVLSRAPSKRELAQRAAEEKQRKSKADADLEAADDDEDLGPLGELADLIKGRKK
ncbi:klc-2, partial [Symbiodinium pilosum]